MRGRTCQHSPPSRYRRQLRLHALDQYLFLLLYYSGENTLHSLSATYKTLGQNDHNREGGLYNDFQVRDPISRYLSAKRALWYREGGECWHVRPRMIYVPPTK